MSTHQFIFPPPPPPPPPPSVNAGHVNYVGPPGGHNYGRNSRGNKEDRTSRGRGRFNLKRGSSRGYQGSLNASGQSGYAQGNDSHFSSHNNSGPPTSISRNSYPLPEYPSVQQPQYFPNASNAYSHPVASRPPHLVAPFPSNPEYHNDGQRFAPFLGGQPPSASYTYNPPPQIPSYYPPEPQHYGPRPPMSENPGQPAIMGPPLRMGFKNANTGQTQPAQAHAQIHQPPTLLPPSFLVNPPGRSRSARYDSPNPFQDHRNRGQRRKNDGSTGSRGFHPKLQVAPAVPSFGNPLPIKPPVPQESGQKPKKKRRHNQLGLTPQTVEHVSSDEEENDVDEESKLAIAAGLPDFERQQLRFSYKGRVSTLQSASDITAWIEQRKKRFPTRAKMEAKMQARREVQRHTHEAKQAVIQVIKESKAKHKLESKEMQKAEFKEMKKSKTHGKPNEPCREKEEPKEVKIEQTLSTDNAAAKAKMKVEKLRKRLEKEEKRVAKAEAKVSRLKVEVSDVKLQDSTPAISPPSIKRKRSESVASEVKAELDDAQQAELEQATPPETQAAVAQKSTLRIKNEDDETTRYVEPTPIEPTPIEGKRLAAFSMTHGPLTPTSQPSTTEDVELDSSRNSVQPTSQLLASPSKFAVLDNQANNSKELHHLNIDRSAGSSPVSDSTLSSSSLSSSGDSEDDLTSSEGSSSSSSSSTAPESRPLKRAKPPEKVPSTDQRKSRTICRNFLQSGRCGRGNQCRFRHELPERGSRAEKRKKGVSEGKKSQRLGLYQRLVEQEKQKEKAEAIQKEKEKEKEQEQEQEKNVLPIPEASLQPGESGSLTETVQM